MGRDPDPVWRRGDIVALATAALCLALVVGCAATGARDKTSQATWSSPISACQHPAVAAANTGMCGTPPPLAPERAPGTPPEAARQALAEADAPARTELPDEARAAPAGEADEQTDEQAGDAASAAPGSAAETKPGAPAPRVDGVSVTQMVRVETPGCEKAVCELVNDRGSWRVEGTPASASISTSAEPLVITCRAQDAQSPPVTATVPSSLSTTVAVAAGAVGAAAGATLAMSPAVLAPLMFSPLFPVAIVFAMLAGTAAGAATGIAAGSTVDHAVPRLAYPTTITVAQVCVPTPSAEQTLPAVARD